MVNPNIGLSKISQPLEALHEHLEEILKENVKKSELLGKIAANPSMDKK